MKKLVKYLVLVLLIFTCVAIWYALKWQPLFQSAKPRPAYPIIGHNPDTLLVAFIGDSWAGLHPSSRTDSAVSMEWTLRLGRPVRFVSCGKGGANSGDVYRLMFHQGLPIDSFSSKKLLQQSPDYCIVTVGINDARQNVGTKFYCANYQLILSHLLRCGIHPVIVEVPDVDLQCVFSLKSVKDRIGDAYKAFLAGVGLYNVAEYRQAWQQYLHNSNYKDSVLYVASKSWNPAGFRDTALYLGDCIHLNVEGYQHLDSCLLSEIKQHVNDNK